MNEYDAVNHAFQTIGKHTLKMLGCFNSTLGQICTNPNIGLKM